MTNIFEYSNIFFTRKPNSMKCFFARDMWAPDIVFGNQVSLERAVSTIKNKAEAVVEVLVLDCPEKESKALCEDLGLAVESKSTMIMLKQTASLEVNCPDMDFANFPFDNQFCDFIPFGVKQDEDGGGDDAGKGECLQRCHKVSD